MWSKWKRLTDAQRSQYVLGAMAAVIFVGFVVRSNSDQIDSSPRIEMPADVQMDAAADTPEQALTAIPPAASTSANGTAERSLPPTAVVDGVTYSGEEQIEALTQAARDAGFSEMDARRTGQEAAILCNGNPDCLR